MMTDIFEYLREDPTRTGIILASSPPAAEFGPISSWAAAKTARNRILKNSDGIRTRAFDESRNDRPSLIIYNPVRTVFKPGGDKTGPDRHDIRIYEPGTDPIRRPEDPRFGARRANFTPRVSGVEWADGRYQLSILRTSNGRGCDRAFFDFAPQARRRTFHQHPRGFGSPLPSLPGQPVEMELPDMPGGRACRQTVGCAGRITACSLWVSCAGEEIIKNKTCEADNGKSLN